MSNVIYSCTNCKFQTTNQKYATEHCKGCDGKIIVVKDKARTDKTSK